MVKQVTAYACEFCDKIAKTKATADKHERHCVFNPSERSCPTCAHGDQIQEVTGYWRQLCAKGHTFERGRGADHVFRNCEDHKTGKAVSV